MRIIPGSRGPRRSSFHLALDRRRIISLSTSSWSSYKRHLYWISRRFRVRSEGRCSSVAAVAFRVAASRVPGATLLLHFHRFGSQAVARKLLSNIGLDLFSRQNVGIGIGPVALAELGNAPAI
jgi:hypothetical protein